MSVEKKASFNKQNPITDSANNQGIPNPSPP